MRTHFLPGFLAFICTLPIAFGIMYLFTADFTVELSVFMKYLLAGIALTVFAACFKLFRRLINRTIKDRFPISHIEGDGYLGKTFSDEGRKLTVYKRAAGGNNLSYFCYYYDGNVQVKAPGIYSESFLRERIAE